MKRVHHRTEMLAIMGKKRIPIRLQFGLFIILFTTALAAAILFFTIKGQKEDLTRERTTVGQTLAAHLAAAARDAILLEDDLYVYDIINDMVRNDIEKDIRYLFVTDTSGRILIHSETSRLGDTLDDPITEFAISIHKPLMQKISMNDETVVDYSRPIIENFSKKTIGFARIGLSGESINRVVNKSAKRAITVSLIVLGIGLIASLLWVRLVTNPISQLARGAETIGTGDLSYRFKIKARNELGELAEIFNRMTSDLDHAQQELVIKQRLDHELDLARSLQAALLPDKLPAQNRLAIAAWYNAAKQVGGDYYDFIAVDDKHLGVVIADVSGKSITGAFMMGITRAIMRAIAPDVLSPREALVKLNDVMCANMRKGMFVTMLYVIVDLETLKIKVASAGHDPLFYKKDGSDKYMLINPSGCAIGVSRKTFASKIFEEEIELGSCDTIALTTDGINEATSAEGVIFGEEKMYSYLSDSDCSEPQIIMDKLTAALATHYGDSEPSDDATIVILKVKEEQNA